MPQKKEAECYELNPCAGHYGKCLDVKITNSCNGRCTFCIEKGGYKPPAAPVDALITATNNLKDYRKVLILGGEPFLYPSLPEYLDGIREKEEIYITTNGSAFSGQPLEEIGEYLTGINISIHHHIPAVNNSILGVNVDYGLMENAISIFKRKGVRVRINTNLAMGGIACQYDMLKMIEKAQNLGADEIRFAELQNSPEEFVSAYLVFEGQTLNRSLPKDPYRYGCEHVVFDNGIRVTVRLTCGFVNPTRNKPVPPYRRGSMTKVLYPNGTVYDGWRPKNETINIQPSCH